MTTQVPSSMINQDGGLTASALAADAVTTVKIADANVTTAKLAASAVTPAKLAQPLTLGTSQASTSGTSIDFTSIPSWVKRITVMFNGVSTNGASSVMVQLGAGSVTTTGYSGGGGLISSGGNAIGALSTSGFQLYLQAGDAAATVRYGHVLFTLIGSNTWVMSGVVGNAGASLGVFDGLVALSGTLDRVRITTVNGTDTFDAGSINILYE